MPLHPTAVVDPQAVIDPTADIGPYVVISGPVRIGPAALLRPYAHVTGHTEIGARCQIFSGAVIGEVPQDRGYQGAVSFCRIGEDTVIREGVTIHRGTAEGSATVVGSRCFLMANSHVGHNCTLGDDVTLANGALLAGHVQVGHRAFLSGNAGVHQFVRIGELVMVGGLTKVTQDVPPFCMVDDRGTCVGINVVGMQRAGMGSAERQDARRAYALLYRAHLNLPNALERLEKTVTTEAGRRLVEFLRIRSRRGIVSGPRPDAADTLALPPKPDEQRSDAA